VHSLVDRPAAESRNETAAGLVGRLRRKAPAFLFGPPGPATA